MSDRPETLADADGEVLLRRAARLARRLDTTRAEAGVPAIAVRIGDQNYAFPLTGVRRVEIFATITPLPHVPAAVLGLGASDGEVLAVFDGRAFAGVASRAARGEHVPVLILGSASTSLAIAVDELGGLTDVAGSLVRAPGSPPWLLGLTHDGVLVVDVQALLQDPMFASGNRSIEGVVNDDQEQD
ncbi:MAG: chemotaxis protein CheW [Kofleriaceae bacterium]